jgi:shikimate kinase
MKIGLIGMSGVGKTYWARKLTTMGYDHISCDDMIAAHLAAELGRPVSFEALNRWLGLPYEPGFEAREAKFLSFESRTMEAILAALAEADRRSGDLVVDMSGSAVYAGAELFEKLRRWSTIVYLAITPAVQQRMFERYARRPRAVVWHGQYQREAGQSRQDALKACYPRLIAHREQLYEAYCDVKLERDTYREANLTAERFVRQIRDSAGQLPA